jgi:hypothetical protein
MGKVDDNLTTTDKAYIIARFIGDGSYYWVVTVTRNATLVRRFVTSNNHASKTRGAYYGQRLPLDR